MSCFDATTFIALLCAVLKARRSNDSTSESSISAVYLDLTRRVYHLVAKTLSKDMRPAFAFYLVRSLTENAWTSTEWGVFTGRLRCRLKESSPMPPWADKIYRNSFSALLEYCPSSIQVAKLNEPSWKTWFEHHRCEECFPPSAKLTAVERLLLIQAFRPDRVMSAVEQYCKCELGIGCLDPPLVRLDGVFGDVKGSKAPVLLIAYNGADPGPELESLAEKSVGRER